MGFNKEIDEEVRLMFFRDELISEKCSFSLYQGTEFLRKARFYLNTLEAFLEKEKTAELESLSEHARRIPESNCGDFWARNYPIYWEEMFQEQLRSSFLVSLTSFLEDHLKIICWLATIIRREKKDPRTWFKKVYKRSQDFLEKSGVCFETKKHEWNFINNLYEMRNVFVHFGGRIYSLKDEKREMAIHSFIKNQPNLSESHGYIKVKKEFFYEALEVAESLIFYVHDEIVSLCTRFSKDR